ncbi:MAG TPA: hypothetical protein VER33_07115, partial [Polyangiaceae bacterium]|nr:hypothetical protein [Polyangiaceae bacterium]
TGIVSVDCIAEVINAAAKPFQDAPPADQGAAGWVAQGLSGVVGVVGAPQQLLDVALSTNPLALALAAACPVWACTAIRG